MGGADKYKKDFDLIFQELDEKERLRRQAAEQPRAEFINQLLKYKSMQDLFSAVPPEERKKINDLCLAAKFPSASTQN